MVSAVMRPGCVQRDASTAATAPNPAHLAALLSRSVTSDSATCAKAAPPSPPPLTMAAVAAVAPGPSGSAAAALCCVATAGHCSISTAPPCRELMPPCSPSGMPLPVRVQPASSSVHVVLPCGEKVQIMSERARSLMGLG